jgi:hypothetical protein
VAVLSVARWEKYRDALQPQFKLSPEEAVMQSLPNTAAFEERLLDAFGLRVKAALPESVRTRTSNVHNETGNAPTYTSDVTDTSTPGDISTLGFEPSPTGTTTASDLPVPSVTGGALGTDPLLKYWTALALWQEVQLVNRYVRDAAIDERFAPYLVRLQVTLLPRYRGAPYDAYTTISFFPGDFPQHDVFADALPPPTAVAAGNVSISIPTSMKDVQIVPLLVTDDLEAALQSRSVDQVRQFALALSAMVQGLGLGGDIQKVEEALRTGVSRDFNATFTIARVSHNTLRVRIGALQRVGVEAQVEYSMIPQTHNVTLLMLVPRNRAEKEAPAERMIRLVSSTAMVDAVSGEVLESRELEAPQERYKAAFESRRVPPPGKEDISILARCVAANDRDGFGEYIKKLGLPIHFIDSLWIDFAAGRDASQYCTAVMVVPSVRQPRVLDETQAPVLFDDGKGSMIAQIRGAADVDPAELVGTLNAVVTLLKTDAPTPANESIELSSTSISISEAGNQLQVTFPSLTALNRKPVDGKDVRLQLKALNKPLDAPGTALEDVFVGAAKSAGLKCTYVAKAIDKVGFDMAVRARVIDADPAGKGRVQVVFEGVPTKAEISLSLEGADIVSLTGQPASMIGKDAKGKLRIVSDGTLVIELENLHSIATVVITARDEKGTGKPATVVLPVAPLPGESGKSSDDGQH